jgi:TonB-linked SusC/RagA family outer membrane protein
MHLSTIKLKALLLSFMAFFAVNVSAQNQTLNGRVVDDKGDPVIGALVLEKGTSNGTTSGADGSFSLRLTEPNALLDISFLGFNPRQVSVMAGRDIIIDLSPQSTSIGTVEVVAVGYGTQKKESVVGAISTIKPAALRIPVRSLSQTLAGNVAGVISLQSSGEPGKDDAQFWIRGIATFTGKAEPLVLVDGIARPLNDVDPLEIESFSVLKDASATAIYGVEGANGVIIVNTRRGFDGPARIDARYEQGFSFPSKRLSFVDAATRSEMFNEAVIASGDNKTLYEDWELAAMRNQTDPELYPDVDWQDLIMSPVSLSEKVSANISGGGRFARYFTALSFYNAEGQYRVNPGKYSWISDDIGRFGKNINYKRYNFRTNVDMDITSTTVVSLGIQGNVTENTEPSVGSNTIYLDMINAAPNAFPITFKDGKSAGRDGLENPYSDLTRKGWKRTTGNTLRANLRVNQDFKFITQGLRASVTYAYDAQNYDEANRSKGLNYWAATGRNEDTNALNLVEYRPGEATDVLSYASRGWGDRTQYAEATVNYERTFAEKHEVSGLLIGYAKGFRTQTSDSYLNSLPNKSIGLGARITYSYDRRYLFEANLGYNGSENFPEGRKMGVFPALAVGWVISEESFLKGSPILTWAKIRASYGQVGNDKIYSEDVPQRFLYLPTVNDDARGYGGFGELFNQGGGGVGEGRPASPFAQWEVATKYNLGVELGFWNALTLNTDLFYERRDKIFTAPQASELTGLPSGPEYVLQTNVGAMELKGVEVTGEYAKQFGPDFTLTVRGNFTFSRNKILADGKFYPYPWQSVIGTRAGERLGYKAMHLFSEDELQSLPEYYTQFGLGYATGGLRPGDIRYEDLNDDGKIDATDRTWIGNPSVPEIMYGFGAEMKWKNLDFSFLFQGAGNRSSYMSAAWYFQPFQADRGPQYMGNIMTMFLDRWTESNPNPHAFSPRLSSLPNGNNYQTSTWWNYNSDYLRLKNIEVGYTLPANVSQKLSMSMLRVYVTAMNVFTVGEFINKFWDPETGADRYPIQRQIFVGLNLTF